MTQYFQNLIKKHKGAAVLSILICYLFYLLKYPESYKLGIIASMATTAAVYAVTGNFFFSLFSVYSLSLPFKVPAKQYHFLYASPTEYQYELLPDGVFDNSYFTISTLWGALLVLYYVNQFFHYVLLKKTTNITFFISLFRTPIVYLSLFSWSIYFFLSFIGSLTFSFNPSYSINYLVHESNIIVIYIGVLYLFLVEKKGGYYFSLILLASITFHGLIGVSQILRLFTEQNYIQNVPIIDAEQRLLFQRINGVLGPNRHAYLIAIYSLMLLPLTRFIKNKTTLLFVLFLAAINIIFSQSRTVWLGIGAITLLCYAFNKKRLLSIFSTVRSRVKLRYLIISIILIFIIIIPRISVSNIFFSEEGGGALRKQMFTEGLQLLHLSPWFGFGAGTTVRALLDNFQKSYVQVFPDSVHFTYLQLAIESGIPATIAFFIPYYLFIRQVFVLKVGKKWKNDMLLCVIGIIILTNVYFFFQPISGRTEFGYSGIILGLGAVALIQVSRHKV